VVHLLKQQAICQIKGRMSVVGEVKEIIKERDNNFQQSALSSLVSSSSSSLDGNPANLNYLQMFRLMQRKMPAWPGTLYTESAPYIIDLNEEIHDSDKERKKERDEQVRVKDGKWVEAWRSSGPTVAPMRQAFMDIVKRFHNIKSNGEHGPLYSEL
jgi:hypothetical protein